MHIRSIFTILNGAAILLAQVNPQFTKGDATITESETRAIVQTLADKPFAGRLTGHPGYRAAAQWTAAKFKAWGLSPLPGTQNFLQAYPCPYSVIDQASLVITIPGQSLTAKSPRDYLPMLFADAGRAKGGAVFVGWGIHAPELGYDDYAGMDVKGKFVLCFRGAPDRDNKWVHHDEHRTRMALARSKGALGLLYIYPEVGANPNGDFTPAFLPGTISENLADQILANAKESVASLKQRMKDTKKPLSMSLPEVALEVAIQAKHFPKGEGYNVAAYLPGSDPKFSHECVIVGGHLDHVGEHMGILFPGADDNASGSAVVMQAARALVASGLRPKRSVVFVLFGSEEQGCHGSNYFVKALPQPFTKMTAMLNFDMQGLGTKANIHLSTPLATDRNFLTQADEGLGVMGNVNIVESIGVRSGDITAFFKKGVGVTSVYSNGKRPASSYHLPGDNISIIQDRIMVDIAKLAYRYASLLAER